MEHSNQYYRTVGSYYDFDAAEFDSRYWKNPVLQQIRNAFRQEVKKQSFSHVLEIGIGTGFDMAHFARIYPDAHFYGIDVSPEMCRISTERCDALGLRNVKIAVGSVEDVENLFPGIGFDMIYVFFGALNTVENLGKAAEVMDKLLSEQGSMVLTFVNKWYIAGMLVELLKGRFRAAFSRIRVVWGGYSPNRFLPSKCYTPGDVQHAFRGFRSVKRIGYCIMQPAWYYHGLNRMPQKLSRLLISMDAAFNRTFLWKFGEYTLFTFERNKT